MAGVADTPLVSAAAGSARNNINKMAAATPPAGNNFRLCLSDVFIGLENATSIGLYQDISPAARVYKEIFFRH